MSTHLNVKYRGKDIAVELSTATCNKDRVSYLCQIPDTENFEIELTGNAAWVIIGKPVISAKLVELIGDAYVNSIL